MEVNRNKEKVCMVCGTPDNATEIEDVGHFSLFCETLNEMVESTMILFIAIIRKVPCRLSIV